MIYKVERTDVVKPGEDHFMVVIARSEEYAKRIATVFSNDFVGKPLIVSEVDPLKYGEVLYVSKY